MTDEDQKIVADIRATASRRIADLNAAYESDTGKEYVFCWDRYALGVKITNGVPATVGVEHATIVSRGDTRRFSNGSHQQAMLMPRRVALRAALRTVGASYEYLEAALKKKQVQLPTPEHRAAFDAVLAEREAK